MNINNAAPVGAAADDKIHNLNHMQIPHDEEMVNNNKSDSDNQQKTVSQNEPLTRSEPIKKVYQKFHYCDGDSRPYRVIVENTDLDKRKHINRLQIGILLNQIGFDKCIDDIKKTGRNKANVYVGNMHDANRLADCQNLLLKGYKAYIPKKFVTVTGVISDIPTEITPEEVLENVICDVKVESVFRMTRRMNDERIPTNRVGIVFRSNVLPRWVRLYSVINRVDPFIPRPVICFKCLRYNHLSKNCKSSFTRCKNCTEEMKEDHEPCSRTTYCFHCKQEGHNTTDRNCPRRKKENEIQTVMAKRNLTYQEARESFYIPTENHFDVLRNAEDYPALADTFAKVVSNGTKNSTTNFGTLRKIPTTKQTVQKNKPTLNNRKTKAIEIEEEETGVASLLGLSRRDFFKKRRLEEEREENNNKRVVNIHRTSEVDRVRQEMNNKTEKRQEYDAMITCLIEKIAEILKNHGVTGDEITASIVGELKNIADHQEGGP